MEEDASAARVSTVFTQWITLYNKLQLCVLFFKWLSLTEVNYEKGNRQLLAVKLALA